MDHFISPRVSCSVKEHGIRLAAAFQAPVVIMHSRGHIVPPLSNPHLAALRAFLTSMRDEGCPEHYLVRQRQQQAQAAAAEPLDPPLPMWETEAEQVAKLQKQKQQHRQQSSQQQQQLPAGLQVQQGQYTQVIKLDGQIGRVPQLASRL